ncbi:MAG: hypothetical protein QOK42_1074 [Frankiaceae bacterium]|jgi:hypothetical protein|nr:hypothetical protein [Frankiaceae bacterium]MDX6225154.1 hypothetical protein [Frankiales bacterium]MDX6274542.1 hypothetical protein [Frankiales bacterium]
MEQAHVSDDSPPSGDEGPTLASDMRSSALLFGLAGAVVGGALLLTRALGA